MPSTQKGLRAYAKRTRLQLARKRPPYTEADIDASIDGGVKVSVELAGCRRCLLFSFERRSLINPLERGG
jgi:hypothetical protein